MSSSSSSGYGSAATTAEMETATTSTHVTSVTCTSIATQPYYPNNPKGQYGNGGQLTDDSGREQIDAELLPSINDFQFSAALNAANNGVGMWPAVNPDFWNSSVHANHLRTATPANYDTYRLQ